MSSPTNNAMVNGVKHFAANHFKDNRGSFTKIWSASWESDKHFTAREFFYSDSTYGVLRGMHLQIGKAACPRYISVLEGKIVDVVLDLRPNSTTFLNWQALEMDSLDKCTIYVPEGVAHGFQALESAKTLYISGENHVPTLDTGINSNSFGFNWPIQNPTRSRRDESLLSLTDWLEKYR